MSWKSWERAAESGPEAILVKLGCLAVVVVLFGGCLGVIGWVAGWFSEAGQVVQKEFGATAALKKYEWFKDAAAQLDAKAASIKVYESRMAALRADYAGQPRAKWSREDREQVNLWEQELAGIRASYNGLAAEYNAAHAKLNWVFADVGSLPAGAAVALPREDRTYLEN